MSEALTIEQFAAELAQADAPEQPPIEDSGTDAPEQVEDEAIHDEAPAEESEEAPPEQPAEDSERVIKWKTANGDEFEATEDELKAGYLRQKDYTQKAQAVAQERESNRQQLAKQAEVVETLANEIGTLRHYQLQLADYEKLDWNQLAQTDPVTASQAMVQFNLLKDRANAAYAKVMEAKSKVEAERSESFQANVAKAEAALVEKVKGVTRDEVVKAFKSLQSMGADQQTIDAVRSNAALAQTLIEAQRWRDLQSKKPAVENKVRSLPPVTTKARQAVPQSQGERLHKAIAEKKTFSASEFASLLSKVK